MKKANAVWGLIAAVGLVMAPVAATADEFPESTEASVEQVVSTTEVTEDATSKPVPISEEAPVSPDPAPVVTKDKTPKSKGHDPVTVCHKPGTPAQKTLTFDDDGYKAHLNHGDTKGACVPLPDPVDTSVWVEWVVPVGVTPSPLANVDIPEGASVGKTGYPQWALGHANAPTCDAWVQKDRYPSQEIADGFLADGKLTYGEDHGYSSDWTFWYLGDCPPPVTPANPMAAVTDSCGVAQVTLTNPGENNLTASFVINLDGEFYNAYAVFADDTQVVDFTFTEDSGVHLVEVYQSGTSEWKLVGSADVESDCLAPEPLTGTEVVDETSECVDEERVSETWVRNWTQEYVQDSETNGWVLGEKVYGEPYMSASSTMPDEECETVVVPPKPTPSPSVTPDPEATPEAIPASALAYTGSEWVFITYASIAGAIITALGIGGVVMGSRRRRTRA